VAFHYKRESDSYDIDQPITSAQGHAKLVYMNVAYSSSSEMQEKIIGTVASVQTYAKIEVQEKNGIQFLGPYAELRKATISVFMYIRPAVRPH